MVPKVGTACRHATSQPTPRIIMTAGILLSNLILKQACSRIDPSCPRQECFCAFAPQDCQIILLYSCNLCGQTYPCVFAEVNVRISMEPAISDARFYHTCANLYCLSNGFLISLLGLLPRCW